MKEPIMVMIDLETMSTYSNAAIASIGAVKFDAQSGDIFKSTFYQTVDLKDCKALGLHFSKDTIAWWKSQPKEVFEHLTVNNVPLKEALEKFIDWYGPKSFPTWGCGSDFDNVIMQNAFRVVNLSCPWKYYHNRCYRTLRETVGFVESPRQGNHHNALDDAMHQAIHLLKILGS